MGSVALGVKIPNPPDHAPVVIPPVIEPFNGTSIPEHEVKSIPASTTTSGSIVRVN